VPTIVRSSVFLVLLACQRERATPPPTGPCDVYEQRLAQCPDELRAKLGDQLATAKQTMHDKARLTGMCTRAIEALRGVCP
jgi:hypothetical protein